MMPGPPRITLDQESFKALASDVRVGILKVLDDRRQTVTDLSNVMGLSKPTLLEHLEKLQSAGLVKRLDEGRKWIYYDLTRRGRHILNPHQVKIMISLAVSLLLVGAGVASVAFAAITTTGSGGTTTFSSDEGTPLLGTQGGRSIPQAIAEGAPGPWGLIVIALAVIPLVVALWYRRAGRDLIDSVRAQLAP